MTKSKVIVIIPVLLLFAALIGLKYMHDTRDSANAVAAIKEKSVESTGTGVGNKKDVSGKERKETSDNTAATDESNERSADISTDKSTDKSTEKNRILTITAAGDILLGRGVGMRLENQNKGYLYPFEKVADILKKGDVIFGNLEEPITDSTHSLSPEGKIVLRNKVAAFEGIKYAGFNLLNLANNHIMDYYDRGLQDTLDILDRYGIAHSGAGKNLQDARKPAIIEKNGVKVGMLAYTDMSEYFYKGNPQIRFAADMENPGVAPREYGLIKEDVEKLRGSVDILIVSLHWGKEESFDILQEQTDLAHRLVDDGVDVIIGHHPHQFQGIEVYKGKPVIYSMGNFIFDQNDPENQESFILEMVFTDRELTGFTAIPVRTVGKTQVVPQTAESASGLLEREIKLCSQLNTKCSVEGDRLIFDLNATKDITELFPQYYLSVTRNLNDY